MSNIISATLQSKKKQIQTVFAQIRGVFTCLCTSAMLPSYLFLAFCRFLPKIQPVWVVGGQLSNWAASLTSSVINRAKSGRIFFVHLQALMQHRECTLKGAVARNGAWGTPLPLPMSDPTHHTQRLSFSAGACPSSAGSGKRVFCYYEGKRPPSEVDPCPCTHLLYKNVHIDHNSRLRFTDRNIFLML